MHLNVILRLFHLAQFIFTVLALCVLIPYLSVCRASLIEELVLWLDPIETG